MACEYYSRTVWEQFTDAGLLEKALNRVNRQNYIVDGLQVGAYRRQDMGPLKQAYQVETAKAQAKKKGFFVSEQKDKNGKIKLTVRA